jgi:DNA-binding response OmpR family regulator
MADGGTATVVVANPDRDVCEVLARIVEAAGHRATRVTAIEDVSRAVTASGADVLLLDAGAANLDLLKELRSQDEPLATAVRAIVVGSGPASALLAWQADADAVLNRPFEATEIGAAIAVIQGRDDAERRSERTAQIAALDA